MSSIERIPLDEIGEEIADTNNNEEKPNWKNVDYLETPKIPDISPRITANTNERVKTVLSEKDKKELMST